MGPAIIVRELELECALARNLKPVIDTIHLAHLGED